MTARQEAERLALLADVAASPDDDRPRLVFADWCEDNGDQRRAEFIRTGEALTPAEFWAWFGDGWEDAFPGSPAVQIGLPPVRPGGCLRTWCRVDYDPRDVVPTWSSAVRRGFVEGVIVPLRVWDRFGPAIVSRHPVRKVDVSGLTVFPAQHGNQVYLRTPADSPRWLADSIRLIAPFKDQLAARRWVGDLALAWAREEAEARPASAAP